MAQKEIINHIDPDMFQCSVCGKWGPLRLFIASPEQTKARSKCNVCEYGNMTFEEWLSLNASNLENLVEEHRQRMQNSE